MNNETTFTINIKASSGENYAGAFTVRKRLTHNQTLRRDELRRELVGSKPEFAPEAVHKSAYMLSTCAAYVISGPTWWTENSNGVDLLDEEPISAVFLEIRKVTEAVEAELKGKGESAKEALKTA